MYIPDVGTIRKYSDEKYKITHHNCLRNSGFELDKQINFTAKGKAGNDTKLENSLSRSKSKVFELAYCNTWSLFCTFTISPKRFNRYSLGPFYRTFSVFIRNFNRIHSLNIRYLIIPELHEDGAWHLHALLDGLPISSLILFTLDMKLPYKILHKVKNGELVYDWPAYSSKFGFCSLEIIKNHLSVSKYITKYVTKDLLRSVSELNAHVFYSSKGLHRSEIVYKDYMKNAIADPDFENDYVSMKWLNNFDDCLTFFRKD